VDIAILEEDYTSEWASQHYQSPKRMEPLELFLISEKYFSIPVSNVNPFLYSKDWDMIRSMELFTYATALDLNLGYYHTYQIVCLFPGLFTVIFPWGKCKCTSLQMGKKFASDVFQIIMSKLTQGL
jgi:hypothetical protein